MQLSLYRSTTSLVMILALVGHPLNAQGIGTALGASLGESLGIDADLAAVLGAEDLPRKKGVVQLCALADPVPCVLPNGEIASEAQADLAAAAAEDPVAQEMARLFLQADAELDAAEAEAEAAAEAEAEAAAEAEAEAAEQAAAEEAAAAEAKAAEDAEAAALEAELKAAEEAAAAEEAVAAEAEAKAAEEARAAAEAEADAEAEAEAAAEADADAEAAAALEAELKAAEEAAADTAAEAAAALEAETKAAEVAAAEEADAKALAEAEAEAAAAAEAEAAAATEAEADAVVKAEADAQAAAEAEAQEAAKAAETVEATDDAGLTEEQAAAEAAAQAEAQQEDEPVAAAAVDAEGTDAEPAEGEVVTETIEDDDVRGSGEEFATAEAAAGAEAKAERDGLSDFEKIALLGIGALVVGAILKNGDRVVASTDDRAVVQRDDGTVYILKNDDQTLRQPGSTVETRRFDDGSTLTVVTRQNGTEVRTIRDANGRVLRRTKVLADGTSVVLFDDTEVFEPVDVADLPRDRAEEVELSDADLDAALSRELRGDVGRRFSLAQIRNIRAVRELMPIIELDTITFDTGSAAIRAAEAEEMVELGRAMQRVLDANPGEVFLIEGHTDAVGSATSNLTLSDRRAESLALALTEYFDIPPENLIVQGYGEAYLKVPTLAAERANRRVAVRRITPLLTASN